MSDKNNGGPAFGHGSENGHCCGMSLRDWFAGEAMKLLKNEMGFWPEQIAKEAFLIADAMIAERDK